MRSPAAVAVGIGVSGVGTYVFLIAAGRSLGPVDYASFSVAWAAVVTLGLGVFLPFETEVARRAAAAGGPGAAADAPAQPSGVVRTALLVSAVATAVVAVVLLAGLPWTVGLVSGDRALVAGVALACVGCAVQFPLRGSLSGTRRLVPYAVVLATEGVVRAAAALVLLAVGSTRPAAFVAVLTVAALASAGAGVLAAGPFVVTGPRVAAGTLAASVVHLSVGALLAQLLLNGGVIVAKGLSTDDEAALAGTLLATMSVTRIPVFGFQAVQAAVVPRIAREYRDGHRDAFVRLLRRLVAAVALVGALTVAGSAVLGPTAVRLLFGPAFEVDVQLCVLLALGVAAFLLAVTSSDALAAIGGSRELAVGWFVGTLVGAVVVVGLDDLLLRVTLPLVAGGTVAAASHLLLLRRRLRRPHPHEDQPSSSDPDRPYPVAERPC